MYIRKHFQPRSESDSLGFIREHPFGILTHATSSAPIATHIPMELEWRDEDEVYLVGHLAAANPQAELIRQALPALAIFSHAHTYVSSGWYQKKSVPTWNYIAVHVYGIPRSLPEQRYLSLLEKQVSAYEAGRPDPERITDVPQQMMDALIKGILAFEMKIERTEATFKLSQNKSSEDREEIIRQLQQSADPFSQWIGERMRNQIATE